MFLSLCTNVFEPITFFNLYSVLISNIKRPSGSIKQVLILVKRVNNDFGGRT